MVELLFGLIGVLLGGGFRAIEIRNARNHEAKAVLSALVAEVEALTRMANHRQYLPALQTLVGYAEQLIAEGAGARSCDFVQFTVSERMFAVYDASISKIGLLNPYHADRIVRFYTLARGFITNYGPESPFRGSVTANEVAAVCRNDLEICRVILILGDEIAGFRNVSTLPTNASALEFADVSPAAPDKPSATP